MCIAASSHPTKAKQSTAGYCGGLVFNLDISFSRCILEFSCRWELQPLRLAKLGQFAKLVEGWREYRAIGVDGPCSV